MFIIAECGSNPAPAWNFSQWCEGARAVGADAIKMQIFKAEHFPKYEWASKRPLEFPRERISDFRGAAFEFELTHGVSAFDIQALTLAFHWCDFVKLAAREQANNDLTDFAIWYSIGNQATVYRSISDFRYFDRSIGHSNVVTLFALQSYPAGMVRSIIALFRAAAFFKSRRVRWGWSSHTTGILDAILAKRLGADVLEKHFALGSTDLEAGHSLLPPAFSRMVEQCRSL